MSSGVGCPVVSCERKKREFLGYNFCNREPSGVLGVERGPLAVDQAAVDGDGHRQGQHDVAPGQRGDARRTVPHAQGQQADDHPGSDLGSHLLASLILQASHPCDQQDDGRDRKAHPPASPTDRRVLGVGVAVQPHAHHSHQCHASVGPELAPVRASLRLRRTLRRSLLRFGLAGRRRCSLRHLISR